MTRRLTVKDIRERKQHAPLVCLTAYTAPFTKILDPHVDLLLVGDTVGMIVYGMDSTLGVDLEMMIRHGKAVVNASHQACVVVDLPFGSYQASPEKAFESASRLLAETGCQAVKLEGGQEMAETVAFLVARGIPVMGHIGLQPQSVNVYGGYFYQGRTKSARKQLLDAAKALEKAGAFAVVVECVEASLAAELTQNLTIPTIGIGASAACDGQVLVTEDMLGLFSDYTPKFVKQYGQVAQEIEESVKQFASDVREKTFPQDIHSYGD